jgi:hypothetical protein
MLNRQILSSEEKTNMVSYGKPNGQSTVKQSAPVIPTKMKKGGGCGCGK